MSGNNKYKVKWCYLTFVPVVFIAFFLYGCSTKKESEYISETRLLLGTVSTISIYDSSDRSLLIDAFLLCEEYEKMLSMNVEGSDVWRINHGKGEAVDVSSETVEVISAGLYYSAISEGLFDITIGRLTSLWDFNGNPVVPKPEDIEEALSTIDYKMVHVSGNTVQLDNPDTWLDLGAIAKGYIADKVAKYLIDHGVRSAVIELGGDVVTIGTNNDGEAWRIGIAKPFASISEIVGAVEIVNLSIVSSGVYSRYFEMDGVSYHHILDPRTGMPVDTKIVSATIIASSVMDGDALATIALLMGIDNVATNKVASLSVLDTSSYYKGAVIITDDDELLLLGEIVFYPFE
ncbi:MAG: FAD:protein FMN transferase [Oscillospiraceae bacterium]|nr:FAD:protein FMN transferase [Oscillospiraceae bacterium]